MTPTGRGHRDAPAVIAEGADPRLVRASSTPTGRHPRRRGRRRGRRLDEAGRSRRDRSITAYDADGNRLWTQGPGYGTVELTVLDDGTVQACDDLGGEVLDPANGEVVRDATSEECPEEFDGADTTADDVYDVEGSELVVYDDADLTEEQFRITLDDPDAVAWGVDGGVATYSESSHQLRFYR